MLQQHLPFTVLKLYSHTLCSPSGSRVATAPTVYGIETKNSFFSGPAIAIMLQQHLPFTVLKRYTTCNINTNRSIVATAPTVYGIETKLEQTALLANNLCCNSTYRLRY